MLQRSVESTTVKSSPLWGDTHFVAPPRHAGVLVNDIHSQLNATRLHDIVGVDSCELIASAILRARREGLAISVGGARHAMGAQQFGSGTLHLDMTKLNRVLHFDAELGIVEAEAGIEWPELIGQLNAMQRGRSGQWGIAQKQTGADRLTLGGALAANAHGRGLRMKPFVSDVESFTLVGADGEARVCSREQNSELFHLVAGGYGLFGVVSSIRLRLTPRRKLERLVEVITRDALIDAFGQRVRDGYLYGDFQFAIDERSDGFLNQGVFSCYRPVDPATPAPDHQLQLSAEHWKELLYLAHADKAAAFRAYSEFYLSTSGQVYWSDTHQLSAYLDDYHRPLDRRLGSTHKATEIITEIFVPRERLCDFLEEAAGDFRRHGVNLIYGTIRLIERDDDSFLAWAKRPYACVIFNLHTVHSAEGLAHSASAFRRLMDMAIHRGGSYFLTYHKFATRAQLEACYPQFPEFLRLKSKYDPEERFQSDWYRHYRDAV
ncbi:MAG: FAD-binding oxidoreductase [Bryobacterales bacterium]